MIITKLSKCSIITIALQCYIAPGETDTHELERGGRAGAFDGYPTSPAARCQQQTIMPWGYSRLAPISTPHPQREMLKCWHTPTTSNQFTNLSGQGRCKEDIRSCTMTQNHRKQNKVDLLPCTEDQVALVKHQKQKIAEQASQMERNPHRSTQHNKTDTVLSRIIVFNKRRSGEVGKMKQTRKWLHSLKQRT